MYNYFKKMAEKKHELKHEFRLKNIDETRNYLIEEINRNKLISKKHKNLCITLIYFEPFLVLQSAITGCVSIPIGITSSAIGSKISATTAGIEKYKTIIKKKKKKA